MALTENFPKRYDTDMETSENPRSKAYIPALSYDWLTPAFDPLLKWIMREDVFKPALIKAARLENASSVLDLGCGTGTLTILAKEQVPAIDIIGVDIDPAVLEIARRKAHRADVKIRWEIGMADALTFEEATFDRVLSSLMFHHLKTVEKKRAFTEVYRVLKPGADLYLVDYAKPRTITMRLIATVFRKLEEVEDHFKGLLPEMMRSAGFIQVNEVEHFSTNLGPLSIFHGRKPTSAT